MMFGETAAIQNYAVRMITINLQGVSADRFVDDQFGVLVQGNIEEKQLPSDQLNATYSTPVRSSVVVTTPPTFYVPTASAELTDNTTTRHRYGGSLILDYTSDFVDVKFFNLYDQKKDSSITRDNTTQFNSREFFDQVFVNQTKTDQRTNSLQALFKIGGTELPVSLSYTKSDSHAPNGLEFDFYQTGVQSTPQGYALTYGTPLNLINAMGVFNPGNPSSYLNNIQISNADLVDATYDAKLDWKIPFKLSDYISGKISLGGKYHSVNRTSIGSQEQEYLQYGDGSGSRLAIQAFIRKSLPGSCGTNGCWCQPERHFCLSFRGSELLKNRYFRISYRAELV